MAENKKGFLLYCDIIELIEELTDEEAGKLFKHLLRYVNDLNPEPPDRVTKIAFEPIKHQLKRDLKKYEESKEGKRKAGLLSAERRKQQKPTGVDSVDENSTHVDSVEQKPTHVESVAKNPTDPTVTVTDTVNVTVNDTVTDTVIFKEASPDEILERKKNDIRESEDWLTMIAKNNSTPLVDVKLKLEEFFLECENNLEIRKARDQLQTHFYRWIKKKIENERKKPHDTTTSRFDKHNIPSADITDTLATFRRELYGNQGAKHSPQPL